MARLLNVPYICKFVLHDPFLPVWSVQGIDLQYVNIGNSLNGLVFMHVMCHVCFWLETSRWWNNWHQLRILMFCECNVRCLFAVWVQLLHATTINVACVELLLLGTTVAGNQWPSDYVIVLGTNGCQTACYCVFKTGVKLHIRVMSTW